MKAGRFLGLLCALGIIANPGSAAEPPSAPTPSAASAAKHYTFELQTFNNPDRVRRGRAPFSGAAIEFNIASAMTDEEMEAVTELLDQLGASPPDEDGFRSLKMSDDSQVRIGGFAEDTEVAGSGVDRLPLQFAVANEFSTTHAALVLRIVRAGNLFVVGADDSNAVATPAAVTDKRFHKRFKNVTVTADENAFAEWIRQNVTPQNQPSENEPPPDEADDR